MIRVGIDVGGTGIKIGIVDEKIQIIQEGSIPTVTDIPFEDQVKRIVDCVLSTVEKAGLSPDDIESVGVGIPGIASSETGEIIKCTNMGWNHVPFREVFQRYLDKPVFIDNDANVAALAESVAGVSAGTSSSVFITIGTGIGSGIIINGQIWKGAHGIGGELGPELVHRAGLKNAVGQGRGNARAEIKAVQRPGEHRAQAPADQGKGQDDDGQPGQLLIISFTGEIRGAHGDQHGEGAVIRGGVIADAVDQVGQKAHDDPGNISAQRRRKRAADVVQKQGQAQAQRRLHPQKIDQQAARAEQQRDETVFRFGRCRMVFLHNAVHLA